MGKILKTLLYGGDISLSLLETTDIVNTAIEYHKLSPLAAAALGRTMTAVAFMASSMKNEDDKLSVTITGDGVGGQIVVCSDSALHIRGYIENPQADLPLNKFGKLDVAGCVGKRGRISVVKNLGLKEPYTGSCHIISGEIAEDFASYYTFSEQQPTGMALGVKIGKDLSCVGAGGVVLQPMPGATEESIDKAEKLLSEFSQVSSMIEDGGLDGVVEKFFKGETFEEYTPVYKCNCSKEYVDKVLITLGEKELYDSVKKDGKIEVVCHFCPKKYTYLKEDVDALLGKNG
ncbi:MAG: Hsp33 family molecular chaperone HslO [Clostridia bacterium]|nr:Hsp33 family molecular chaperone HslO [Clostridia bacterium]